MGDAMAKKLPRKVLLIGSGGIKVAEAAEFDYSGSQALQALRDLKIKSIVMNPNIATVQTSYTMADSVYILPISFEYIKRVILAEKPDALLCGFGGQTALTAGLELWDSGFLKANGVEFVGTNPSGIRKALARADFQRLMRKEKIPVPPSFGVKNAEEGIKAANSLGFPVICRVSFNLGGRGSFVAYNMEEFKDSINKAFAQSGTGEALVEKYLNGWKELEYEVMRDIDGNSAIIACLENIDPMGIHTGESVVVAPAQTLDNHIYQRMRSVAIRVADAIGLVGECNVQFALDPNSYDFYVIETNPRMSRSSALASKVTGYPIAYVATKLALGFRMHELSNEISNSTSAYFEPSLDYIAIKIPRWDIQKFERVDQSLSSEMKSIGEVMGIGRNFEEAMQKAVRMLDIGEHGIVSVNSKITSIKRNDALDALRNRKPYWFLYAAQAFIEGASIDEVEGVTGINRFFISKIYGIVKDYINFKGASASEKRVMLNYMLRKGFSEAQLKCEMESEKPKRIDTLAGEWHSNTNYMYLTKNADSCESDFGDIQGKKVLVLGAGCFRIGVSVEFDYATTIIGSIAKSRGYSVATLNCNPETVSTDWNRSDMLFFDQLSAKSINSISKSTNIKDVIIFAGGQIGNNIASELSRNGMRIIGSDSRSIAMAEDRESFSRITDELGIKEPEWQKVTSIKDAIAFAERIKYPVLIRPSFVLSGSSMGVANNESKLIERISKIENIYKKKPIVISKFIKNAEEADMDCAADGNAAIGIPMFHIEKAGIHSGDSTMMIFPSDSEEMKPRIRVLQEMKDDVIKLVKRLNIKGPFNLQFALKDNNAYVIELNLRASRSMPFSSKGSGFELMEYAMHGSISQFDWKGFYEPRIKAYGVKSPQFSWAQMKGAYPALGPEMHSTGEVAAFDSNIKAALLKSWLSVQPNRLPLNAALIYGNNADIIGNEMRRWNDGLHLYSLDSSVDGLKDGAKKLSINDAIKMIKINAIDAVFTDGDMPEYDYGIRRACADFNVPIVLDSDLGTELSKSLGATTEAYELRHYR